MNDPYHAVEITKLGIKLNTVVKLLFFIKSLTTN